MGALIALLVVCFFFLNSCASVCVKFSAGDSDFDCVCACAVPVTLAVSVFVTVTAPLTVPVPAPVTVSMTVPVTAPVLCSSALPPTHELCAWVPRGKEVPTPGSEEEQYLGCWRGLFEERPIGVARNTLKELLPVPRLRERKREEDSGRRRSKRGLDLDSASDLPGCQPSRHMLRLCHEAGRRSWVVPLRHMGLFFVL